MTGKTEHWTEELDDVGDALYDKIHNHMDNDLYGWSNWDDIDTEEEFGMGEDEFMERLTSKEYRVTVTVEMRTY